MPHAARRGLCSPRLAWIAIAVGVAVACTVAAQQARSEPATAVQLAAPFTSDRLSVEVVGQGPDVILIPGYASSREVWRVQADRLKATHRIHLIQLAGFAGEPWVHGDGPFVEPMVADLARYIDQAGLDRPAVIGHSMGGLTGLMLAERHPERIGKLMTVDSLPFFSALFGPQATAETARPFADQAAQSILNADAAAFEVAQTRTALGLARDPAARSAMVASSLASDRQALATAIHEVMLTDLRPALPSVTTPVWALYASDADGGASATTADALWTREYETLAGVRLIRVDDSRHFIMADQPQRFAAIVDEFLASGSGQ